MVRAWANVRLADRRIAEPVELRVALQTFTQICGAIQGEREGDAP